MSPPVGRTRIAPQRTLDIPIPPPQRVEDTTAPQREAGLAPSQPRSTKAEVQPPAAKPTQASTERAKTVERAAREVRDTLRAWPVDAHFVASAFEKGDQKKIAQVFDTWAAEQKAIGAPGVSMLVPIVQLYHEQGRVKELTALSKKLGAPIMSAIEQLSRQNADPAVLALVAKLGGIVQTATPTEDADVTRQRYARVRSVIAEVEALRLPKGETDALDRLTASALSAVKIAALHSPLQWSWVSGKSGAFLDVSQFLLKADDRWVARLIGEKAFDRLAGPDLEAIASLLRRTPEDVREYLALSLEELSARIDPLVLRTAIDTYITFGGELGANAMRLVNLPAFAAYSAQEQMAFFARYRALPRLDDKGLQEILPTLMRHCANGMRAPAALHQAIDVMPMPFTLHPITDRTSVPYDVFPGASFADYFLTEDTEQKATVAGRVETYEVRFADGVTSAIVAEPPPANAVSHQAAVDALATIPADIRRFAHHINLTSYTPKNALMWADPRTNEITSFHAAFGRTPTELRSSFIHEAGHVLAFGELGASHDPRWSRWAKAAEADGTLASKYADESLHEDVAETLVLFEYVRGTPLEAPVRALFAHRFALLEEMLKP